MQPRAEHLDEIEEARIAPVEVFEDQQRRPLGGNALEKSADREEERLPVGDRLQAVEPEHDREVTGDCLPFVADGFTRRLAELRHATASGSLSKIPASCLSCAANAP